jgi:hypothetical protein
MQIFSQDTKRQVLSLSTENFFIKNRPEISMGLDLGQCEQAIPSRALACFAIPDFVLYTELVAAGKHDRADIMRTET